MKVVKEGDTAVVRFPARCEGTFTKTLIELLREDANKNLPKCILDLSETGFIDSSTVGTLVRLEKDFKSRNAALILRSPQESILELFKETGLDAIFDIETKTGFSEKLLDIFEEIVEIRLEINPEKIKDVFIMHLSGIMSHPEGSRFFKQQFLLAMADYKKILLDFGNLTFFDSLSVSVVLSMNKLLKQTGGTLKFAGANYIVSDLFTTLNIDKIIPVFDTVEEALRGF